MPKGRLSWMAASLSMAGLLFITVDSAAYYKPHQSYHKSYKDEDYKGEDYKGEVVRAPCPPEVILRDGLYVGGALGHDAYRIRQSVSLVDTNGNLIHADPAVTPSGLVGGLFAGYGRYFDTFYIAGEVLLNYTDANTSFGINKYQSNLKAQMSYGVSMLPGVKVNYTSLLYARLGYLRTYFKTQEGGVPGGGTSTSNWGNGLELGLGIETVIYQNVSARMEYNYISYGSFTSNLGSKYTPSNSEFMLGVLYRFDFM